MSEPLVTDPESGMFSEAMLRALLPSRVATARRTLRQLGLVLVTIGDGPSPEQISALADTTVRDSDISARLDDGTVVLVLEFTPADGCQVVVDRMRGLLAEDHPGTGLAAGIACYPAHAISAEELLEVARGALADAGADGTVVAPVPD